MSPQPAQHQPVHPGREHQMEPKPDFDPTYYKGSGKLQDKVAIITGGDSGIGRAVAVLFAREGADVVIPYLEENTDAEETKELVEKEGRRCFILQTDISQKQNCHEVVDKALQEFQKVNILVNNAAVQYPKESILDISEEQLEKTFRTNFFSYFFMIQETLPHLHEGDSIINTTSVTAYKGSWHLLDYSSTKGAIVTLTRSLSQSLVKQKIRVNGVAPGPIWTPLIPSSFEAKKVETFGSQSPMGRAGQPEEVSPSYVFLASKDSSYMTGQILHPNGGDIVNG